VTTKEDGCVNIFHLKRSFKPHFLASSFLLLYWERKDYIYDMTLCFRLERKLNTFSSGFLYSKHGIFWCLKNCFFPFHWKARRKTNFKLIGNRVVSKKIEIAAKTCSNSNYCKLYKIWWNSRKILKPSQEHNLNNWIRWGGKWGIRLKAIVESWKEKISSSPQQTFQVF
jgi:hypothetical protein